MSQLHAEASALIEATCQKVYDLLRDYQTGHPSILPKAYFPKLEITGGGQGAGTKFTVTTRVMGVEQVYNMVVTEPTPGRKLVEIDAAHGLVTTFEVVATSDKQTRLTITTDSKASPGLKGAIERLLVPRVMGSIYKKELGLIVAHFAD